MQFPDDVRGWLSEPEGQKLAGLATGKRVLEIGSFCGRSTVCMAQTAASVVCIDPFDGRATDQTGTGTEKEFLDNLRRYDVGDRVQHHVGTTQEIAPNLPRGQFDVIFIDGAHDYRSVLIDIHWAQKLVAPGGLICFHDYKRPIDPEVTEAVNDFISAGAVLVEVVDTVAVIKPPARATVQRVRVSDTSKPLVFLAMPSYDGKVSIGSAEAYFLGPTRGACNVVRGRACSSFLTKTFNDLWCSALTHRAQGITHFAMIHADIIPDQHGWLDILLGELIRLDADVVSAVSPIKSEHGWTSTAVGIDPDDPWVRRRLTMKEVYDLPETFSSEDVGGPLLINTGLWVCRLNRPWCEQVCFDVFNRIVRQPNGEWHAEAIPEDWLLGAALHRLGCKTYATRKVTLAHDGGKQYTTDHVWGTQQTDEVFQSIIGRIKGDSHAEDSVHEALQGEGSDGEREPELCRGASR